MKRKSELRELADIASGKVQLDRSSRRRSTNMRKLLDMLRDVDDDVLENYGLTREDVHTDSSSSSRNLPAWVKSCDAVKKYAEATLVSSSGVEPVDSDEEFVEVPDDGSAVPLGPPPFSTNDVDFVGQRWYLFLLDLKFCGGKWQLACNLGNCNSAVFSGFRYDRGEFDFKRSNILKHFENNHKDDKWFVFDYFV